MRDWVEAQSDEQKAMRAHARQDRRRAEEAGAELMALARGRRRPPRRLLAGLRRRAVDAAAGDHVPAVGLRAGAVPAQPRDQRQGRGADPPQLADQRADAVAGARAGQHPGRPGFSSPTCRPRWRPPKASGRGWSSCLSQGAGAGAEATARIGTLSGELDSERQISQRALSPGRAAQPADRGAAQADRRARGRARRVGSARPRIQHQDRRSRPPAERRAGPARAGTEPLPLRLLRPAARDPLRPREHPHRRRPLRLPVGSAVSRPAPRRSTTPARSR